MTNIAEIKKQIQETRKEMRAKGIRRMSCFNGGLHGEVYSLNARMFYLETELKEAKKRQAAEAEKVGLRWPDGLQNY
jgi:predicted  nucleic acid-binding Zn-ribbon protein